MKKVSLFFYLFVCLFVCFFLSFFLCYLCFANVGLAHPGLSTQMPMGQMPVGGA